MNNLVQRVPRGRQILLFDTYDLQDGWTNLSQTFRDYRGYPGERPRKRIFWKIWKMTKLHFWHPCTVGLWQKVWLKPKVAWTRVSYDSVYILAPSGTPLRLWVNRENVLENVHLKFQEQQQWKNSTQSGESPFRSWRQSRWRRRRRRCQSSTAPSGSARPPWPRTRRPRSRLLRGWRSWKKERN